MKEKIFSIVSCFFFSNDTLGCKKVLGYIKVHPNGVSEQCRVKQLILLPDDYFGQDTVKFIYDDLGNPTNNIALFDAIYQKGVVVYSCK